MTMRRLSRNKLLALLAALLLCAGGAATGVAAGQDTSAVAVNTKDNSSVFRFAFKIVKVNGDTVDNGNAAVAYASCTLCQTVAISIQVLLISSDPTDFEPTNIAFAYNENCTLCDTLATAYQFALGVGEKLKFTAEGRRQLAEIRQGLEGLRGSGLTGAAIQDAVDGYVRQLSSVLSDELIGQNEPAGGEQAQAPGAGAPAPTTTAEPDQGTTATDGASTIEQPAPAPTDTTPTTTETTPTTTTTTPTETTTEPPPTSTTGG